MDADALIKLTKASLKEATVDAMDIIIPPKVKIEAVDEGKRGNHADALLIEENIEGKRLRVEDYSPTETTKRAQQDLNLADGETHVLNLFTATDADILASDDAAFLRLINDMSIPFTTPAALVVALVELGALDSKTALDKLEKLAPHISEAEHVATREALLEDHE